MQLSEIQKAQKSTEHKRELYLDLIQVLKIQLEESHQICKNLFTFYTGDLLISFQQKMEIYRKSEQNKLSGIYTKYLSYVSNMGDPNVPVFMAPLMPEISKQTENSTIYELIFTIQKQLHTEEAYSMLQIKYENAIARILPFLEGKMSYEQFITKWE